MKKKGVDVESLERYYTKPEAGTPAKTPKFKGMTPVGRPIGLPSSQTKPIAMRTAVPASPVFMSSQAVAIPAATYVAQKPALDVHLTVPKTAVPAPKADGAPVKLFKARLPEPKTPIPAAKPEAPKPIAKVTTPASAKPIKPAAKTPTPKSAAKPVTKPAAPNQAPAAPKSTPAPVPAPQPAPAGESVMKTISPFLTALTLLGCPQVSA